MPMTHALDAYSLEMVEFVRVHEAWATPLAFALAFGESLAFLSLLIPAWAALIGIGALIGAGNLNFWPIWIAAALGAALGDWLSYWLGIRIGRPIAKMWPLSRHPKLLPNAEAFVRRWGAPAIVIGRFFGPLRECAAGRRHFSHALLAVSDREFRFGHPLGGDTAHGWGRGQFSP